LDKVPRRPGDGTRSAARIEHPLAGTPGEIVDKLGAYTELGIRRFYLEVSTWRISTIWSSSPARWPGNSADPRRQKRAIAILTRASAINLARLATLGPAPRSRGLGHRLTRAPTASSTSADEQHRTAQHHFRPTNHTGNPIQRGHYISGVLGIPIDGASLANRPRSWSATPALADRARSPASRDVLLCPCRDLWLSEWVAPQQS
jgi:hypothetical protein